MSLRRSAWAGAAGLLLLWAAPALAHIALRSATPAADSTLDVAPRELRLAFSAAVEPGLARLTLVGPHGPVALGPPRREPDSGAVLLAPIQGELTAGTFEVRWQIAGPDGHPVRGGYSFTIAPGASGLAVGSATAATAPPPDPGPTAPGQEAPPAEHHAREADDARFDTASPLYAAVRWLTFTGLLVVIGAVSFALLLLPSLRRRNPSLRAEALGRARARAASVGLVAGGVLAAALVLRLLAQSAALHPPGAGLVGELTGAMLTRTLWGWGWILQAVATAALLLGLWTARRGRGGGWGVAAPATLALAATPALSGHAAATSALAVLADSLHVLAAGGWLGTLLLVLLVGLPVLLSAADSRTAAAASLLGAFSPLALAFAGILALTGVYAAWIHLPDLPALWSSAYGRTLLVKLAALSLVLVTGAYNWRRAGPAAERTGNVRPLARSAAAELAMGAVVLAVTAALVATPPPAEDGSLAVQGGSAPAAPSAPAPTR